MEECCFGPVRFIPGENRGRYPFCHTVYVEDAKILIDPASNRERLIRLRTESGVKAVWLSHWHEDHFMHLDLFDDMPLYISELDAPMLSDLELFLDGYGMGNEEFRAAWRKLLRKQFHFQPRQPAGFLREGQSIEMVGVTVDLLHTPGHTPGHMAFYFREPGVLFLGDYDLTKFGPWYGDRDSSIRETIASVERLKNVSAVVWLTSHETGVFEENPGDLWNRYVNVIYQREAKLLDFLTVPRTLEEIVNVWIVYGKPREPKEFYAFGEQAIMTKHLDFLIEKERVVKERDRYVRA